MQRQLEMKDEEIKQLRELVAAQNKNIKDIYEHHQKSIDDSEKIRESQIEHTKIYWEN